MLYTSALLRLLELSQEGLVEGLESLAVILHSRCKESCSEMPCTFDLPESGSRNDTDTSRFE